MKYIPAGVTRLASRQLLKLNGASPTILVVTGVVGLAATAVLAAKATTNIEPVIVDHKKARIQLDETVYANKAAHSQALIRLYTRSAMDFTKLYGPAIAVGTLSAASVLYGHKILKGRHVATMAAYSGLMDQFKNYRGRVAQTLGEAAEKDIYNGAHGEWQEDPDHKGEHKLVPVFDENGLSTEFHRPWFDETVAGFTTHPTANYSYLLGIQQHMNVKLRNHGHLFVNDVFDALNLPRTKEGVVSGWLYEDEGNGDGYVDLGFLTDDTPNTIAFRNHSTPRVQLNLNHQGSIWDRI